MSSGRGWSLLSIGTLPRQLLHGLSSQAYVGFFLFGFLSHGTLSWALCALIALALSRDFEVLSEKFYAIEHSRSVGAWFIDWALGYRSYSFRRIELDELRSLAGSDIPGLATVQRVLGRINYPVMPV